INLGDVMVEGGDLYGDGVNIAARLEALAEPGSVLVAQAVANNVRSKASLSIEDLGDRSLKNLAGPVRVYRVRGRGSPNQAKESEHPALARASIAVLPFVNLSGDAEQEYFADGLTEDLITELSRFKSLQVTARNSSFHFKGKAPKIPDLGRELQVA